ncbi:phosphopantothenate--cysteine ligase [Streptococcus sp. zg-JUN1979]|uniref:phosphopantothenate--cysteine ligase n=1 Tax=Streptococcus sp. zg-JUN1979 TaxID=3391450 RepID=UPI0039A558CF
MKILITSGGTSEAIDSVRSITNHSTGQLGALIAQTFLEQGHQVTLLTTKNAIKPQSHPKLSTIIITNTASLQKELQERVLEHDVCIHSMAVSDYRPIYMTDIDKLDAEENVRNFLTKENDQAKISSDSDYQVLFLEKTPKLLSHIKEWNPNIILVGFKLLVDVSEKELLSVAKASLIKNKADFILANDLTHIDTNKHIGFLVSKDAIQKANTKPAIAQLIYEKVTHHV